MKIGDLVKQIRNEKGLSQERLAEMLGFSMQFVSRIESGAGKVSASFLSKIVEKFPAYKKKLIHLYSLQNLPEDLQEEYADLNPRNAIDKAKDYNLKVYSFNSSGSGKVDLEKYKTEKHALLIEQWEHMGPDSMVFEVEGNGMEPYFLDGDLMVLKKEEFQSWESLDSNLILVKMGNAYYLRKLFFDEGNPFLYSFNRRLYPPIELEENAEFISVLSGQIDRDVRNIKFK